jgi:hypothetical protein
MAQDDDPHAPYTVYEGAELKGTYTTRAEARRAQQRLESQAAGSGPERPCVSSEDSWQPTGCIKDGDHSDCHHCHGDHYVFVSVGTFEYSHSALPSEMLPGSEFFGP